MSQQPNTIYRKDYQQPDFFVSTIDLTFDLQEEWTTVTSQVVYHRHTSDKNCPLHLHGQNLKLISVKLDQRELTTSEFQVDDQGLTINNVPETFQLEIVTQIQPQLNTTLMGLYKSSGNFCTQCEAEGFRRITFYLDRPDVMASFTTTIIADKTRYPVLLSNGNLIEEHELDNNRHLAKWHDPFKKPSYLFALVAGKLGCVEDTFITMSNREITLRIFVQPGNENKCQHAMHSLKLAMKWDEEKYGREYDLDIFMIVAVDDFNMGAMENKGLNVFNSKCVLANYETGTDQDFVLISLVIGHEYFHNWTGNRVTCRDWFQLSLKEGLTVFREQEFTGDITTRGVNRIKDATKLRLHQFPQDNGPIAHSVRPDSYIEINNFYTTTIYEKGAEVIRMMETYLGKDGFRKGMDLYFDRHDGQAVTCDDFVKAMEDANQVDFTDFRLWYSQAGTPRVSVTRKYDAANQTYTLTFIQKTPPTPGQPEKKVLTMPIKIGLIYPNGDEYHFADGQTSHVVNFNQAEQSFFFEHVKEQPIPSVLRNFSAPVKLNMDLKENELVFLMANDSDPFNRFEASQKLATKIILKLTQDVINGDELKLDEDFAKGMQEILFSAKIDNLLKSRVMMLPSEIILADLMDEYDPQALHRAKQFVTHYLAQHLQNDLLKLYHDNTSDKAYEFNVSEMGRRAIRNCALNYLMALETQEVYQLVKDQYHDSNNMTDRMVALSLLADSRCDKREQALKDFYDQWHKEPQVMDKWFTVQVTADLPNTVENVEQLILHPAFNMKNPNKVKAVFGAFAINNLVHFHREDGRGYQLLGENMLALDRFNPQTAARIIEPLTRWQKLKPHHRELMKAQLIKIKEDKKLSKDMYEVINKSLS